MSEKSKRLVELLFDGYDPDISSPYDLKARIEGAFDEKENEIQYARALILDLFSELDHITKDDRACDHSVGVCWCTTIRILESAEGYLRHHVVLKGEKKP